MTIAVQPHLSYGPRVPDLLIDRLEKLGRDFCVLVYERRIKRAESSHFFEKTRPEERIARLPAETIATERGTLQEATTRTDGVHAAERATDELQRATSIDLRRARGKTGKYRKSQPGPLVQKPIAGRERRSDRQICSREFRTELELFDDLGVSPTLRSVKLEYQHAVRRRAHLINAVFVGVEGEETAIALHPQRFDGLEHGIGRKLREGSGDGRVQCADFRRSAAFSAIMMVGALVLPPIKRGITEASTTRRPATPRSRNSASTTAPSSAPMRQVPTGW